MLDPQPSNSLRSPPPFTSLSQTFFFLLLRRLRLSVAGPTPQPVHFCFGCLNPIIPKFVYSFSYVFPFLLYFFFELQCRAELRVPLLKVPLFSLLFVAVE